MAGKRIVFIVIVLLVIQTLLRTWFWIANRSLFPALSFPEGVSLVARGIQQDWVSLLCANLPTFFILIATAWMRPSAVRRWLVLLARRLFIAGNSLVIALNCIDIGYFRFGLHRTNLDLRFVLGGSLGSFGSLFIHYWPLLLAFGGLLFLVAKMARLLPASDARRSPFTLLVSQIILFGLLCLSTGLPGRPVIPATPLLSVSPQALPVAQNSLLTLLYSCVRGSHSLKPAVYYPTDQLKQLAWTTHTLGHPNPDRPPGFKKRNVIIFILESFSRCYVMPGDEHKANTPFFDSLIRKSLFFPHAFANGFTSNQGIVSILGGLPALMDAPFFYSAYANTPLNSIGNILRENGYNTNFLMGAGRDHFGFGKFSRMAGLDHTYWRDDFNDDRFYDGNWGIFDEPFLQYGARVLSEKQQPFLAVFFTISAHAPYTIPADLRQRFAVEGKTAPEQAIAYTDYAFRQFFDSIRDRPWFHNSLFAFCADHWMDPEDGRTPFSPINSFSIPIFIYDPAREEGEIRSTVAGQVDVAPTLLDMLGYAGQYSGLGHSLIDYSIPDSSRYIINRTGVLYQIITDSYVLGYDRDRGSAYLYKYTTDSELKNNLLNDVPSKTVRQWLESRVKANIQAYEQALTRRSLK